MNANELEARLTRLEAIVVELLRKPENADIAKYWLHRIQGTLANNPDYDEAVARFGGKYPESLRPKNNEDDSEWYFLIQLNVQKNGAFIAKTVLRLPNLYLLDNIWNKMSY